MERSMRKSSGGANKWWTGFWEIGGKVMYSCTRVNIDLALIAARDIGLTLIVRISAFD